MCQVSERSLTNLPPSALANSSAFKWKQYRSSLSRCILRCDAKCAARVANRKFPTLGFCPFVWSDWREEGGQRIVLGHFLSVLQSLSKNLRSETRFYPQAEK